MDSKLILNVEAKEKIARYAAGLVQEGEVIYLDAGTTPLRMIPYLRDKRITIVTTNVLISRNWEEPARNALLWAAALTWRWVPWWET